MQEEIKEVFEAATEYEELANSVLSLCEEYNVPQRIVDLLGRAKEVLRPFGTLITSIDQWVESRRQQCYISRYKALTSAGLDTDTVRACLIDSTLKDQILALRISNSVTEAISKSAKERAEYRNIHRDLDMLKRVRSKLS